MIVRIVKMEFQPEKANDFETLFKSIKHKIVQTEGCFHLELWRDISNQNIFFTYSKWESQFFLDQYKQTDVFKRAWPKAKSMFAKKPAAWSVKQIVVQKASI
ncbi:MAG: putative quinol monooxygenase [Chitinophagales bacterium]